MSESYLPQVDIICACYNSAQYLPEMIESVLHQDYPKAELFIQDGGSTDGTIDILRRYPIQWASEADNGISQALNRAIRATRGEIIGFTSTDDLIQTGAISAAVEVFERKPQVVMVYGDCYMIDSEGRPFKVLKSRSFDLDQLFWDCQISYQTVYVKRRAVCDVGGFDESLKVMQDKDLFLRLGAHFPVESFEYIPRIQGSYRLLYDSAGWSNLRRCADCLDDVMARFLNDPIKVARLRKGRKRAMAGGLLSLATLHALGGQRLPALKEYARAVGAYPQLLFSRAGILNLVQLLSGVRFWRVYKKAQHAMGLAIWRNQLGRDCQRKE